MKQIKECVVYKIENIINGRFYIGVTTRYKQRMQEHKYTPPVKMIADTKEYDFDNFFNKEIIFQGTEEECYKLSNEQVITIRNRAKDTDDTLVKIAKDYDVSAHTIGDIINNLYYKDVSGPIVGKDYIKDRSTKKKLTDSQVKEILDRGHKTKQAYCDIAKDYPVVAVTISQVIRGVANAYNHIVGMRLGIDYQIRGEGSAS